MLQHTQLKPTPPSERAAVEISPTFDRVILACLEKDPDHRPATAETLASQLAAVDTAAPWTMVRMRQWWDANHPVIQAPSHNAEDLEVTRTISA
jgi:hypothetical protein